MPFYVIRQEKNEDSTNRRSDSVILRFIVVTVADRPS